jgi:hypothetical protein
MLCPGIGRERQEKWQAKSLAVAGANDEDLAQQ